MIGNAVYIMLIAASQLDETDETGEDRRMTTQKINQICIICR